MVRVSRTLWYVELSSLVRGVAIARRPLRVRNRMVHYRCMDDVRQMRTSVPWGDEPGPARPTGAAGRPAHGGGAPRGGEGCAQPSQASATASAGLLARRTPSSSAAGRRGELPGVEQDHRPAEAARQADLAERAPGAAQGDHHVAAGHHAEVTGVADGAADAVAELGGGALAVGIRQDADGDAAAPLHAAGHGAHHAVAPAADDHQTGRREQLAELLGAGLELGARLARADHAHVLGAHRASSFRC